MELQPLHYVIRTADRAKTVEFYTKTLGMKILRHEEFSDPCKAMCNGPFDGKWSKTMLGYGPEEAHFVIEVVYNYGVTKYDLGSFFGAFTIKSHDVFESARDKSRVDSEFICIRDCNGYLFCIFNTPNDNNKDPFCKLALNVRNLKRSVGKLKMNSITCNHMISWENFKDYYSNFDEAKVVYASPTSASIHFNESDFELELVELRDQPFLSGSGCGRIAFAVPSDLLLHLQEKFSSTEGKILNNITSLETPGKATVEVLILADPDGHEICLVGREGFMQLCVMDPKGAELFNTAIQEERELRLIAESFGG
ncbi:Glyoxalase 1 [Trichinella pseudospiralis]|uniref:Glyoxalase 1 n=2 Tax=Trichinella pseudospiralis TaxID=6337 RepID=A0A0V1IGN1_TRIPS|nr:Glyoxalase 1 [Trichinella pseudospiralis]KRY75324.1 Glyoxalase 1 [Trichinella pseudospiralis]KRY85309.1 Glyoxalase 1 [Trichinella pseudospiralis]KRZ21684.1 Glyoxalase 1 [Trichinella pseudospiralis]KRZ27830.1 Glyoxalase 1 [Trichinella pseudospiralis]